MSLQKLSQEMLMLSDIVYSMQEFNNIANAFESLGKRLQKVEKVESPQLLKNLFYATLDNVKNWVDNIFVSKIAVDIHYMDASFVSDAISIEAIFGSEDNDEDVMLF